MNQTKQKWNSGDIVKIPLKNGEWTFGRLLKNPLVAFYDLKTNDIPPLNRIISSPIVFKIWVMNHAVTGGKWPIIGTSPLESELLESPVFFKLDRISGKLSIYTGGGSERPAKRGEWEGLECAAVWEPEHVVDRLDDHFAGRPNKWVESLKPKIFLHPDE